ncbi:hypothetical protein HNQ81_002934 [Desulfoprunum benzoelyticum]|uniref:Flavodoxin-like domain-containing protein n=1 Tax=Desulfoprunum benzoelyticum TaxID=1506996 RepID=A0A840UWB5_9BACT|nr:hypothetical protein [Desulfoprunum benzoelyticum]
MKTFVAQRRVLILFYTFSSQTRNLLNNLAKGLNEGGVEVRLEQLKPLTPPPFPVGSYIGALKMMVAAFLRRPVAVAPPDKTCFSHWDLVICAGPTWSYHLSGPMVYFLQQYSSEMLAGKIVLPLISCRTYWRLHAWEMRRYLLRCGARVMPPRVFQHPCPGLWCAIGVFIKITGKIPRTCRSLVQRHCPRFGHSPQQLEEARDLGSRLAEVLMAGQIDENFSVEEVVRTGNRRDSSNRAR